MTADSIEEPKSFIPRPESMPILSQIIEPEKLVSRDEELSTEDQ